MPVSGPDAPKSLGELIVFSVGVGIKPWSFVHIDSCLGHRTICYDSKSLRLDQSAGVERTMTTSTTVRRNGNGPDALG